MKTFKQSPGDPYAVSAIMVPKTEQFHDHEVVLINSSDSDKSIEKKIFRIVDGGEENWNCNLSNAERPS